MLESSPSSTEHTFLIAAILENLARKKTGSDILRQRIQTYTRDTSVHTYPDTDGVYRNFHFEKCIQKSPDTPSVYGGHVWTLGVSA